MNGESIVDFNCDPVNGQTCLDFERLITYLFIHLFTYYTLNLFTYLLIIYIVTYFFDLLKSL